VLFVIILFCWVIFCCFVRIIVDNSDIIIIIDVSSDTIFIIIFIDDVIFITIIVYIEFFICIYISFKIIFNNSTVLIIDFIVVIVMTLLLDLITLPEFVIGKNFMKKRVSWFVFHKFNSTG